MASLADDMCDLDILGREMDANDNYNHDEEWLNISVPTTSVLRGHKRKASQMSLSGDNIDPAVAIAPKPKGNGLDSSLAPIGNVHDAFRDIIQRIVTNGGQNFPDLIEIAETGGFSLDVATMCSGTEAPIFALKLLQSEFFALTGLELFRMRHNFSVEIEAFKQAYIRRNTDAKVFRDVRDFAVPNLLGSRILTALGSLELVPTTPNILIVGTSCIAFSNLSNKKQKGFNEATTKLQKLLQKAKKLKCQPERGEVSQLLMEIVETANMSESDATFFPVLAYVFHQRPAIVIFENVFDAPWVDMRDWYFPAVDYTAEFQACDTKDYYLPQTRSRRYLVAFDNDRFGGKMMCEDIAKDAKSFLNALARRASVDVENFLYSNMDKAIQIDMQQLEFEKASKLTRELPWEHSRVRHENTRKQEGLGRGHPLSGMKSTGETNFYDRCNSIVMGKETDRVKDVSDINMLRGFMAKPSYDLRFKVKIIDFSQNVDRNTATTPYGLTPCLTPNGMPFLTIQCRYIMGRECLLLQGLPSDAVNLSRETYDQLKSLAGNAMTTTIVASSFLSAIMAIFKNSSCREFPRIDNENEDYAGSHSSTPTPNIIEGTLRTIPDFGTCTFEVATTGFVLDLAARIRIYCFCTGTAIYSSAVLWKCVICGTIRCDSCKGNPKHEYRKMELIPKAFGQDEAMLRLMKHIPRVFQGLFDANLSSLLLKEFDHVLHAHSPESKEPSLELTTAVFFFEGIYRSEVISICYSSRCGFNLKVMIDRESMTWYLFLDGHSDLGKAFTAVTKKGGQAFGPAGSRLRDFCLQGRPFARARLTDREVASIPISSQWTPWEFERPRRGSEGNYIYDLRVEVAVLADSGDIEITRIKDDSASLSPVAHSIVESILGTWSRKPDCDVAENSLFVLHKRNGKSLFLFKDPTRIGPAELDTFVVSETPRLLQWHEHREVLLTFVPMANSSKQIHKLQRGTHIQKITMDGHWGTNGV